jgi:hypothetical protein
MDNNHQNLTDTIAILNYQGVNHFKTFQSPLAEGRLPELNFKVGINCLLVLATAQSTGAPKALHEARRKWRSNPASAGRNPEQ